MPPVIRLQSVHEVPHPREVVWPVLAKTDWLNRSLGLPAVRYDFAARAEGGSAITAKARVGALVLRWHEMPFEWIEPDFYAVRRTFDSGPFTEIRLGLDLIPLAKGARLVFYTELEPRNALGKLLTRWALPAKAERDARKIVVHLTRYLGGHERVMLPLLPVHRANDVALRAGLATLLGEGFPPALIERLEVLLRESPDVEVSYLRPLLIARRWSADSSEVLRLFLHATRAGLVDLSWEVLCPNCRSAPAPIGSLRDLRRTAHCDVCQINFDAEFDKSVELKFSVNPAIRPPERRTFCISGPGGKPHVVAQVWLAPGETRVLLLPPQSAPLRMRSPQVQRVELLPREQRAGLTISCEPAQFSLSHDAAQPGTAIRNPNPFPVLVAFEQTAWSEDVLTASRVTNWQEFRDLFASEVVSPAEEIAVGAQVVLFTDLCGSTAMYTGLGDAPAYALVRDHFTVVTDAVRKFHGGVVKTIGDSVMACFSRVDEALAAVREMYRALQATSPELAGAIILKSSLHIGACIAVNANDRLDFFGTTINRAARMVDCCRGGDLAVSDELRQRPEMAEFLRGLPREPELSEVHFRGFREPHRVWRIEMVP